MKEMLTKPSIMTFAHLGTPSLHAYSNLIEQQEQRIAQLKKQLALNDKKAGSLRIKTPNRIAKLKHDHQERVRAYIELELLEENLAREKVRISQIKGEPYTPALKEEINLKQKIYKISTLLMSKFLN